MSFTLHGKKEKTVARRLTDSQTGLEYQCPDLKKRSEADAENARK
jgi:hypothetical protein